jgi:hypothetical protein
MLRCKVLATWNGEANFTLRGQLHANVQMAQLEPQGSKLAAIGMYLIVFLLNFVFICFH